MFRLKSEVDKHVSGLLYKAKTEHERNLRCFHIAQLYYKSQDYESAQRYVTMYLSVRDDSAAAHKLLGQSLEGLGQKEKAMDAYTKSLKLEPDQSDLILKICELLCDKEVQFDPVLARHWADRASAIFPHSPPVFMLKEKLLASDSTLSSKDLEGLLHAELKAKPMDLNVRIKLLKLYADSGRTELALKNAFEVESRQTNINSFSWYQCIHNICKAYNRENFVKCGWEFYIQWLSALDKMCSLCVTETTSLENSDAADCIYSLDQAVYLANQCSKRPEVLREFIKHISAQLAYHIGILLMKKEKKENTLWKETKRFVGPLFLLATTTPPQPDQGWALSLKDHNRKLIQSWVHQAHCRNVQAGYLLISLVKENHSEKMFLDKVGHFTSSDWKRQIYEKAFNTVCEVNTSTSHFMTGAEFVKVPLKLPHSSNMKPYSYVSSFEHCFYGSLHHLTWLGLRSLKKTSILDIKLPSFHTTCFKSLQLTINNLNNISVETINRLDVDSFLYATVFSTALIMEDQKTNGFSVEERPQILPADISSPLCTAEQAKWWSNLCNLLKGGMSPQMNTHESLSDLRFSLQRGLEIVRGEGLSAFLTVALARTFAARAASSNDFEESEGCHARALHLWQIAYPALERLVTNKPLISPSQTSLFENPLKDVTQHEAKVLLEEAKFFIGCHYMNTQQYERAVEEFKSIKTPQAIFSLATVYQKWAEEQIDGVKGEEITSEIRCRHVVLASKARDYLINVKSMIKNDPKHPLHASVESKIFEVEDMLARIEPENGISERDVNGTTDGSASFGTGGSPITEALNIRSINQRNRLHVTSTPRRLQEEKTNRFNMTELIDLLSVQQSTNQLKMQQVLEQIRLVLDKLENVASEQRSQRNLVEGLTSRMNNFESEMKSNISDIKKDMKRPELCNMFDEDDYTDEMLQYQNYSQYYGTPQRVLQNTAAPAAVPFVNPQYFSPRIDPLCPGFYNQQGALPFSEGQQLPDFLRQTKVSQPLLHSLQPGIPQPLNLAAAVPGPSRLGTNSMLPSNVVLPAPDPLPTVTPIMQPALSVNIPTSQRLTTPGAPHNFQIPLPPQPKPTLTIEERVIEEETPPPTYDPLPDYKPTVPLPAEVEVHTGEENEEILFEKRAKLFRYVDKIWKERGVGNIKILKNKNTGKVRILMRREQVHKICANHFLTADMNLQPKINTENAWIWFANDFADEVVQSENFCVKFKTSEDSEEFKNVFDRAKEELKVVKDVPSSVRDVSSSYQPIKPSESSTLLTPSCNTTKVPPPVTGVSNTFSYSDISISVSKPSLFGVDSKSQERSSQVASSQASSNLGGFTFSLSQPKLKAPEMPKPEKEVASSEPSPFSKFSFPISTTSKDAASIFSKIASPKITEPPKPFSGSFFSSNLTAISGSGSTSLFSSSQSATSSQQEKKDIHENKSSRIPESFDSTSKEEEADNFVPTATFEPVIPLPKLISVKTGEENEEIIFEDRAQLYRYCKETKQWKERGIGQMKILKNNETGSARLLMRRDQVLKVCCNHRITKDISFKPASSSDKAYTWATIDHSEEEPTDEIFSLKFKTSDQALRFKEAIEKIQSELSTKQGDTNLNSQGKNEKAPLSSIIKKAPVSWECNKCYTSNKAEKYECAACTAPKPSNSKDKPKSPATDKITDAPQKGNFTFGSVSSTVSKGISLEKVSDKPLNKITSAQPLAEMLKPKPGSWECSVCYIRNNADVEICIACSTVKPGSTVKKSEESNIPKVTFSFGMPQAPDAFQTKPISSIENTTTNQPFTKTFTQFSFGSPSHPVSSNSDLFSKEPGLTSSASDKFTFSPAKFSFGTSSSKEQVFGNVANASAPSKTGFVFSTASAANQSEHTEPTFGSRTFQFSMPVPNVSSPPGNKCQNDESYDPEEEEVQVEFQPVVPLPEKINVVTGEEDEDVLYSHRAKLYRFDSTSKEWKERGLGDVKILQHKDTKKIRFLMRREPVMKVCLNHLITSDMSLRPMSDKSWIWYAVDYSEGTQSNEQFAIRFKNAEIAQNFKDEFEKAKLLLAESSTSTSLTPSSKQGSASSNGTSNESGAGCNSDSDVELISEQKAPPELVEKALSLQLPANYYCYLEKPPCPGCVGCEPEDKDEVLVQNDKLEDVKGNKEAFSSKGTKEDSKENKEENKQIKNTADEKKSVTFQQKLFGKLESLQSAASTDEKKNESSFQQKLLGRIEPVQSAAPTDEKKSDLFHQNLFGKIEPVQSAAPASEKKGDIFHQNLFGRIEPVQSTPPGATIFGGPNVLPKSAGFTFAQAFNSSSDEVPKTTSGFLFGTQTSFTSSIPQAATNIFSSGFSAIGHGLSESSFGSGKDTPTFGSVAATGMCPTSAGQNLSQTSVGKGNDIKEGVSGSNQNTTEMLFGISKDQSMFGSNARGQKDQPSTEFSFGNAAVSFPSFGSLTESGTFGKSSGSFMWEGAGEQVFSSISNNVSDEKSLTQKHTNNKTEDDNDDDEGDQEENTGEIDPYFEPQIPLPDKIEVRTGEEDEDVLFSERGLLYRYSRDTKEWKERGVGEMKILKNKTKNIFRLLMRREQVHKIVCNHFIKEDLELKMKTERAYIWSAMNFCEGVQNLEQLCIRFKTSELALKFKETINDCLRKLKAEDTVTAA